MSESIHKLIIGGARRPSNMLPRNFDADTLMWGDTAKKQFPKHEAPMTRRTFGFDVNEQDSPVIPLGTLRKKSDIAKDTLPWMAHGIEGGKYAIPGRGSEHGLVDMHGAISRMLYQDKGLAHAASKRLENSPFLRPWDGSPTSEFVIGAGGRVSPEAVDPTGANKGLASRHAPELAEYGFPGDTIYIAGHQDNPQSTMLHEMRHGINTDAFRNLGKGDFPGVEEAYRGIAQRAAEGGDSLPPGYGLYLSKPTEVLSHIAEAGDDFVARTGGLVDTLDKADEAMEAWATQGLQGTAKQTYWDAFTKNPAARKGMQQILMRYFAAPAAVGAGAAAGQGASREQSPLGGLMQ